MSENDESPTEETDLENNGGQTVLYAHVRQAMTSDDLANIRDALDEVGFDLVPSEDGEHLMVKRQDQGTAVDIQSILG